MSAKKKTYILRVFWSKDPSVYVDSHTNNPKSRRRQIQTDILVNKGYLEIPSAGCFSRFDKFFEIDMEEIHFKTFKEVFSGALCDAGAVMSTEAMEDERNA